jgi:hypothetical protein
MISGFTFIKNAVHNDYPAMEAIHSILPLVDEFIILAGDSEDGTLDYIQSFMHPKIKLHHSVWDKSLITGGAVLAVETNKAFQLINPKSTWAFYIQCDEVLHEKYYDNIITACEKHKNNVAVQGLLFDYKHFYGTYNYVGDSRRWYNQEIRIIRNDKKIYSYQDAQGFRFDENKKLNVKHANAQMYHYGWVKSPRKMQVKLEDASKYWAGKQYQGLNLNSGEEKVFNYNDFDSLEKFKESHPKIMLPRIAQTNWDFEFDTSQKKLSFKDRLLYTIEKTTGKRLFDYKNYKLI